MRYESTVTIFTPNKFHYKQDTQLRIPGQPELFHHTDQNMLTRVTG